jgi:acetyl esterase/lipase
MKRLGTTALALLLAGCRATTFFVANAPATFANVDHRFDLPYGEFPRQRLDVYAPPHASNRPVVVFWYGGAFVEGSKSDYRFVGTTLAQRGVVAVVADYRLFPDVTFPGFDEDGARAVAWVQKHIHEYGGDPRRIILMGHSAGAHVATFLALNHAFLRKYGADPNGIAGLVGLSGLYIIEPPPGTHYPAFPLPYTDKDFQPLGFADAAAPPTLLLHGDADQELSVEQAAKLRDTLTAHHVHVELRVYPGKGHPDTVASFTPVKRGLTPAVEDAVAFIQSLERAPAAAVAAGT